MERIINTFSGTIGKQPYPAENVFRVITEPVKMFIFHLVLEKPGILLREIVQEVSATLGVTVTESAICKVLTKGGYSYQKLTVCALQQDDALQDQFKADVVLYKKEAIVFINETGSNMQSTAHTHGYSITGK